MPNILTANPQLIAIDAATCMYNMMGTPAPLPNLANCAMTTAISTKVTVQGLPVCVAPATIPISQGDQAAATMGGGAISAVVSSTSRHMLPCTNVLVENKGAAHVASPTIQNQMNSYGGTLVGNPVNGVLLGKTN